MGLEDNSFKVGSDDSLKVGVYAGLIVVGSMVEDEEGLLENSVRLNVTSIVGLMDV